MIDSIYRYHEKHDAKIKSKLLELYKIIKNIIPTSEEKISYNMPSFSIKKPVCYYAANKNHIGFYPTPGPIEVLKTELKGLKYSKGAVQFSYDDDLPKELIEKMILIRVGELKNL